MLAMKIILSIAIISFCSCNVHLANPGNGRRQTSSRVFQKLRSNDIKHCDYVRSNFNKLEGFWYYVLRTVANRNTPTIRCGYIFVNETSTKGFKSKLVYIAQGDEVTETAIIGNYIDETRVDVLQSNHLFTKNLSNEYPSIAEIGLCDNDSILLIEPVLYSGGMMILTRNVPVNLVPLKLRFRTYDEESGKEYIDTVGLNCSFPKH